MNTITTGFRLPTYLKAQLFEICEAKGTFVSTVVTRLLDDFVERELQNPTTQELLAEHRKIQSKAKKSSGSKWHNAQ
ncbi:MAG: hypothetical protein HWE12_00085 [Oceanospirillaceae bacterium]|nr:hypothetical protein [Oceanospirillaceae bacterium]